MDLYMREEQKTVPVFVHEWDQMNKPCQLCRLKKRGTKKRLFVNRSDEQTVDKKLSHFLNGEVINKRYNFCS